LVDIDLATFNLNVSSASDAITGATRAVIPVHLFGQPADMYPVMEMAARHGLLVLEDAACALGSTYHGKNCGTIGDAGCYSFHPRKSITTGEGGMVVTDDAQLAEKIIQLRNHGMSVRNGQIQFVTHGFNYRMTEMQGALGALQMGRIETMIAHRSKIAERYSALLTAVPEVTIPAVLPNARHSWQSYTVLLNPPIDRDSVIASMRRDRVECTLGTYSVGAQPAYQQLRRDCPHSSQAFARSISLPLHRRMGEASVERVVEALDKAIELVMGAG